MRGTYYPTGKNPPEGERKLYLAIESTNELAVSKVRFDPRKRTFSLTHYVRIKYIYLILHLKESAWKLQDDFIHIVAGAPSIACQFF